MSTKRSEITFRPILDKDIPLVEKWIYQEHVLKWYHEPEEWVREMKERNGEFSFLNHFIVYDEDKPFAFCQYYDCFDAQEDWYTVDSIGHTYSIDYLIGDEMYLGKGYGKLIIAALMEKISNHKNAKRIVAQPEKENIPSCKSLESNGFLYDNENQYYYVNLKES